MPKPWKEAKTPRPKILLIDANNLIAKFTHLNRGINGPDGTPVGGLIGAICSLRKFMMRYPHDMIIAAIDDGRPKFRQRLVPEYKTGRDDSREGDPDKELFYQEYKSQMDSLPEFFSPLGIHLAHARGYEADDVIGAMVLRRYKKHEMTIFSEDKDLTQLVGPNCSQYKLSKDTFVHIRPPGYVIAKALQGDKSDDIAGVKGVAETYAGKLIEACPTDSVDDFFTMLPEVKHNGGKRFETVINSTLSEEKLVRRNVRVIDLRRTARKANKKTILEESVLDRKAFKSVARKYGIGRFVMDISFITGPFKRMVFSTGKEEA